MAFTGNATIKKVSEGLLRVTGLSLAAGASGTIGLFGIGVGADVELPENPTKGWKPYEDVSLQDAVQVTANPVADVAGYDEALRVVKTGTVDSDFLITVTNDDGDVATPELELYIRFH